MPEDIELSQDKPHQTDLPEPVRYDGDSPFEIPISRFLMSLLDQRREDVETYVCEELKEEWDEIISNADKYANLLFETQSMLGGDNASLVDKLWDDLGFHELDNSLLLEALCSRLARINLDSLAQAERRLIRLISIVAESKHNDLALGYLRRISKCFIFGFDTECLLMCRAALESALFMVISNAEMKKRFNRPPNWVDSDGVESWSLHSRLLAAKDSRQGYPQRLIGDGIEAAFRIQKHANHAIHPSPIDKNAPPANIEQYIRDLVLVLNQLAKYAGRNA